ncbi:MAG: T9SS type A sorting domain-containing protein [bacterium]|nr:T9SS type A sorting domain-containing protein [bacterium]
MHKLFSIFSILLIYVTVAFGQAAVEIPFTVSDSHGNTRTLIFGLDQTATGGIDVALGEIEQPPFPPGGAFEARFINFTGQSTLGEGTLKDIRNAPSFPFNGTYSHRVKFQPGDPNWTSQTITISWNLPPQIVAGSVISNINFGGSETAPFVGTGSLTIPFPVDYDRVNIIVVYSDITPVELTSFTANLSGQGVILNWRTATELNNQGFEIERSTVEQSWQKIGFVPGFGTTTEPKSYSFLDEKVETGIYSYRLKQIDFDGTFHYSDAVEIEVDLTPDNFILFQNYPNPFNPATTIQFQVPKVSDVNIVVYDMLGQEVKSLFVGQVQAGKYTVEWDGLNNSGAKMSSGTYIYRMTAEEFIDVKEMILLK